MNDLESTNERLPVQPEYTAPPVQTPARANAGELWRLPGAPLLSAGVSASGPADPKRASANLLDKVRELEAEMTRLSRRLDELKQECERSAASDLQEQFATLREAVLRYGFACAEVDMRLALIHARADETGEATANLHRSLAEQTAASNELRRLARSLH